MRARSYAPAGHTPVIRVSHRREALGVIHNARAELMARALPAEDLAALRPLVPIIERLSDQLQSLPPLREPTDEEESHP